MAKGKVGKTVESLGDYLREQRTSAQLSLRQLAEQAGVSNPYLSQIERGLRKPSAEVLQQIAKALRISAEQLYIRAGIVSPTEGSDSSVELAILRDVGLTERQKQSLLDVYASFLALNAAAEKQSDDS
jgi:transcriptional regulator with XRE-family HTH domain